MEQGPLSSAGKQWHNVTIEHHQITIKGGYNHKGEVADCIQYRCEDQLVHTFVALHKEAKWFVKGVGGQQKGDLTRVNVLQMIRALLNDTGCEKETCPAVAGSDSQSSVAGDGADEDPMEALVTLESVTSTVADLVTKPTDLVKKPTKPIVKRRQLDRAGVQEFKVPRRPPCVSGGKLEEVTIFVYMQPARKKQAVHYLRSDCLDWLLSYAADELSCQGVARTDLNPKGCPAIAKKPNCPAVADIHLAWDFGQKRWEAIVLAGHMQGEVIHFGVNDVTRTLFNKLRDMDLVGTSYYCKTHMSTNKAAAKEYIILWCKAITTHNLEEFNSVFEGTLDATATTAAEADAVDGESDDDESSDAEAATAAAEISADAAEADAAAAVSDSNDEELSDA